MVGTSVDIEFDKPVAVYNSGESITGKIIISTQEEVCMLSEIRLEFNGTANIHWANRAKACKAQKSSFVFTSASLAAWMYPDNWRVLRQTITFKGSASGMMLSYGEHEFPFHFTLPKQLPPSFEGQFGRVRYCTKVTVERPARFHYHKRAFTVLTDLDLNKVAYVADSVEWTKKRKLGVSCWGSGDVRVRWTLDKTGYVPGEAIWIQGQIDNHSNKKIMRSKAQLTQKTEYKAVYGTGHELREVISVYKGEVGPGQSQVWQEAITIPPLPPSGLRKFRMINVLYQLQLSVHPAGLTPSIVLPIDITIGTIPIRGMMTFSHTNFSASPSAATSVTDITDLLSVSTVDCRKACATYEASIFGDVNILDDEDTEETEGQLSYRPMYPYYNMGMDKRSEQQRSTESDI